MLDLDNLGRALQFMFQTAIPAIVGLTWLGVLLALWASKTGQSYLDMSSREPAVQDFINSQPTAISIAALVFAGLAFVGTDQPSAELADRLLASLACFVLYYAAAFWPWSFRAQIIADGFQWTGLALFLAAVSVYSLQVAGGSWGPWAVFGASFGVLVLSSRALHSFWRNREAASQSEPKVARS